MICDGFFSDVLKRSECEFEKNKDIGSISSVGISSVVSAIAYPDTEEKLISVIGGLNEVGIQYIVLGRMSNILFKDDFYNGVVIKTTKINGYSEAENKIIASCGASLSAIVRKAAKLDLGGMEGLVGIPGTLGGMIRQNAGAFGYEMSDRFISATCFIPSTGKISAFSKDGMRFSYRKSMLCEEKAILIKATFELIHKKYGDIIEEIADYKNRRLTSQPLEYPSLGSVFKRHNGISAGFYIDKAGLKGYKIGGACVSKKHAGFIINEGGATAQDYLKLIDYVKERVFTEFSIELEEEIEII